MKLHIRTAVSMETTIFWNVNSCRVVDINECFEGTSCLLLQCIRELSALKTEVAGSSVTLIRIYCGVYSRS
jgi:hypothetical protein